MLTLKLPSVQKPKGSDLISYMRGSQVNLQCFNPFNVTRAPYSTRRNQMLKYGK